MNRNTHNDLNNRRGLSLVELIGVLTIIAIICTISIVPVLRVLEEAKARAERKNLALLAAEIKATFRQEDLEAHNISALPGEMPGPYVASPISGAFTSMPTFFEKAFYIDGESTMEFYTGEEPYKLHAWYIKLANLRGQGPVTVGERLNRIQGPVREIVFNNYERRRILIVGPYNEPNVQRYLLLSFAFPKSAGDAFKISDAPTGATAGSADTLADYGDWFNEIYNHNWGVDKGPPAGWSGPWNQVSASAGGKTFAQRVIVERITQRRFNVTVNSTSIEHDVEMFANMANTGDYRMALNGPTAYDALNYYANGRYGGTGIFQNGEGGVWRGFLEGRRVQAWRIWPKRPDPVPPGWVPTERVLMYSFLINENTTVTIQD